LALGKLTALHKPHSWILTASKGRERKREKMGKAERSKGKEKEEKKEEKKV